MQTHTPDNSQAMADAINRVFAPFDQLGLQEVVFANAQQQSHEYDGGSWAFETDGTFGYWYPLDRPTYAVSCPNYYENPAMPAKAFGAALTLVTFNHMIWVLHGRGVSSDILDVANDLYHGLRNWLFDLAEAGEIDSEAFTRFID